MLRLREQKPAWTSGPLIRSATAAFAGTLACAMLLLLLPATSPGARAAPPARPLAVTISDTLVITHTANTTHEMSVFGNGRITSQFYSDDISETNQINSDNITATTIAVMFEQHAGSVDVGSQGEFTLTAPITLETASHVPGYSEDSRAVYASRAISYQITQRTLATRTNNCVIMELGVQNSGNISLTGGKLLYMVDINAGPDPEGDEGFYDSTRRLIYQTDYATTTGYAVGISLLEGDWRGYAITGDGYPAVDADIAGEMLTPTNSITDGNNDVAWLVAAIPDLDPGQNTELALGLCARAATGPGGESQAVANLMDSFDRQSSLEVAKTALPASGSSVLVGEPITFNIVLTSTGYRYVDDIVITDTVPPDTELITYTTSQGSITAEDGLITATVGRMYPASGAVTVTLVAATPITLTDGTVISNRAFISGEPAITRTNVVTHRITNTPLLTLTKSAGRPMVFAGERLTFTLVLSNCDRGYATGVLVSDTLPAGSSFVTATQPYSGPVNGVVTWPLGTLGLDDVRSITMVVRVDSSVVSGTILTNNAWTTGNPGVAASDATTTLVRVSTDLGISKAGYPDPVAAGAGLTYILTVTNYGPSDATGIEVFDILPAETSFNPAASSVNCASSGALITCGIGNLTAGDSATVTLAVTVSSSLAEGAVLTNWAMISGDERDPNASNDGTTAVTEIKRESDLTISQRDHPDPVAAGASLTYTLVVTNYGPSDASGVRVSDALPNGVSLNQAASSPGCTGSGPVICEAGNLAANESTVVTIAVTVTPSLAYGATLTNLAVVTGDETDPHGGNNDSSENTAVNREADLAIFKTHQLDIASLGATLTYTLIYTNNGPSDAQNIILTDTLPVSVTYGGAVSVTPPLSDPTHTGQSLTWYTPTLAAGATGSIVFTVTVDGDARGEVVNSAVITGSVPDDYPENNSAHDSMFVSFALGITKTALDLNGSPLRPGDEIEYRVVVSNSGTFNQDAVTVSDPLPANTTWVTGSATCSPGATCLESGGVVTATVDVLAPGQVLTLTLRARVDDAAAFIGGNVAAVESAQQGEQSTGPVYPPGGGAVESEWFIYLPLVARNS